MNLFSQIKTLKIWLNHGTKLAQLRLKILRLDAPLQIQHLTSMIISGSIILTLLPLLIISLLFGLNTVLATSTKIWVFFGISIISLLLIIILILKIIQSARQQKEYLSQLLQDIEQDIHYLNGKYQQIAENMEIAKNEKR